MKVGMNPMSKNLLMDTIPMAIIKNWKQSVHTTALIPPMEV